MELGAREIRKKEKEELEVFAKQVERNPIYFVLEDIYDTYNIGGLFRLADAVAAKGIFLCGEMETPPNHKIQKASVGTYKVVPWRYYKRPSSAINYLRKNVKGIKIIAVEQSEKSIPYTEAKYAFPLALVLGNETRGVKKETLNLVDEIVEIPMFGVNKSLNVIVAASIVSYWIIGKSPLKGRYRSLNQKQK
jgi:tRNA G18 (ribose-2'-O)-methylase SpoU